MKVSKPELLYDISSEDILSSYSLSSIQTCVERLVLALDIAEREERKNFNDWNSKQTEQFTRHREIANYHSSNNKNERGTYKQPNINDLYKSSINRDTFKKSNNYTNTNTDVYNNTTTKTIKSVNFNDHSQYKI